MDFHIFFLHPKKKKKSKSKSEKKWRLGAIGNFRKKYSEIKKKTLAKNGWEI